MKKLLFTLALLGLFGAGVASADPAVTGISGSPTTTLTFTGTDFGGPPDFVYWETFERTAPIPARLDSLYSTSAFDGNRVMYKSFGDSAYTHVWQGQYMSNAGVYPWRFSDDRAKFGKFSMGANMRDGTSADQGTLGANTYFYPGRAGEGLQGPSTAGRDTLFVSAFHYDEINTSGIADWLVARELIRVTGSAANGNIGIRLDRAVAADTLQFRVRQSTTYGVNFKAETATKWSTKANAWRRIDLFLAGEAPETGNNGRMLFWYDYALIDSSTTGFCKDFGADVTPFTRVEFNKAFSKADSFTTAKTYWDDIYISDTPQRVELGDKPWYTNCTKRYIQFPTAWTDTSITVTPNLGDLACSDKLYVFIVGRNHGNLDATDATCIDSIQVSVPSFTVTSDSTFFNTAAYTLTADNDADDDDLDDYNLLNQWRINWGDGKSEIYNLAGSDTSLSLAHTWRQPGQYTVTLEGENCAGTGRGQGTIFVYNPPGLEDPFPFEVASFGSAEWDSSVAIQYRARCFEFYTPSYDVSVSLWDCLTGHGCRRVFPHNVSNKDTTETLYSGTSRYLDLGHERANVIIFRTLGDSTAVNFGWR